MTSSFWNVLYTILVFLPREYLMGVKEQRKVNVDWTRIHSLLWTLMRWEPNTPYYHGIMGRVKV